MLLESVTDARTASYLVTFRSDEWEYSVTDRIRQGAKRTT